MIGLDRIPEVRTLRSKIKQLTQGDGSQKWSEALCKEWMQSAPEQASILYIEVMSASTMDSKRSSHVTTLPVKNCVCERQPIIGSMRWMVNLLW